MTDNDDIDSSEGMILGPPLPIEASLAFIDGNRVRVVALCNHIPALKQEELLEQGAIKGDLKVEKGRWHFETSVPAENPNPGDPNLYTIHSAEFVAGTGETTQFKPYTVRVKDYDRVTVSKEVMAQLPAELKGLCPRIHSYIERCTPKSSGWSK